MKPRNRNPLRGLLAAALLVAAAACPLPAAANHLEAKLYGVTVWDGGCGGSTRNWWDDMGDAWYDEIGDSSWYYKKFSLTNGDIRNGKYADSSVVAWGADSGYVDDADAALLFWHGSESGNVYQGSLRVDEAGDGNCTLRQDEMKLGNSDLEFLHLSSCQSLDDNQWTQWYRAFDGLHQLTGFHGLMWIGSSLVNDYEDFAADAFDDNIADAWLDNMYVPNIQGNDDQCPVAYGVGNGTTDLWDRMDHERYDNIYSDPTTYTHWGATFITGCDPQGETVVNSDRSS